MNETALDLGAAVLPRYVPFRPLARWLGLSALLIVEVLAVTFLFDTELFYGDPRWWAKLLQHSPMIPQIAAVFAVVMLAFGGRTLTAELDRLAIAEPRPHRVGLLLAGHLAAFAAFIGLTYWISHRSAEQVWGGSMLAWALAGLASFGLWALTALPAPQWLALARKTWGTLAVATFVGGGALLMGQWTKSFWNPLSLSTFWTVTSLLRLAFREIIYIPESLTIGTPVFSVRISPACSGCEGIGLVWALLIGSFWLFRRQFRFPRAFLLLPIGAVLMWAANALRIAGLVAVGTLVSPSIAAGGFHSQTGWIAFNLVGLGLIAGAQRCRFFLVEDAPRSAVTTETDATAAYLMPLLSLVGAAMVTGAFTEGFDRTYPLRMIIVVGVLAAYRRDYRWSRPTWSWEALGIGVAVFALWMALEPSPIGRASGFDPRNELAPAWAAAWLVARVVGSVLVVPLAEELAFRGFLTRRLISPDFQGVPPGRLTWVSMAVSSVAFGLLHGRWFAGTLAGICYALAYHRRGKLGDAVLAHASTNALIAAYVLATGTWSLWS